MAAALFGAATGLLASCAGPLDSTTPRLETQAREVEASIVRDWRQDETQRAVSSIPLDAEGVPQPPALDANSTLPDYIVHAALFNPQLEAAFARWKAALERLPQVRALPDPRFTYGIFLTEVETRVGPQQHRFAVAQTFPWFGKLDLKESIAGRQADAAYQEYLAVRLEVVHAVRDTYFQRAGLEHEIRISRDNIELLKQLESTARVRYSVGTASHPDVIRFQIALEKLRDQLLNLEDSRLAIDARLNAALNRPSTAPVSGDFQLPDESLDADDAFITETMSENNPQLRALQHRIEGGRLATRLARLAEQPDVTLGFDYIVTDEAVNPGVSGSGDDPMIANLSFNVPIWKEKYDAGIREAIANRYAVMRTRAGLTNRLDAQTQLTLFDYRTAERQIVLYRDTLLPKAVLTLEATLSAYQTDTASFLDLLAAQRELLEFELMHIRALTGRARRLALLDKLVGTDLPRRVDGRPPGSTPGLTPRSTPETSPGSSSQEVSES